MAKKRSGSRKSTSFPAAARKKAGARQPRAKARGSRKELNFRPLKRQLKTDIDRLRAVERPDARVKRALAGLQKIQMQMTAMCSPTMVIPLP